MNKAQFVELVQEQGGFKTKAEATKAIEAFTGAVTAALAKQDKVSLVGFGTFGTRLQKGRSGTIPGTKETYTTVDKIVPTFKAGKQFKEAVKEGK